ncbi:hypothetical protein ASPWEDRAFT_70998 [Aspergillus wentii DTO 134E9]|uniref:Uncharacterized protein n=1 Tax=Aspergillus wentii DTO 134E9 TaxID=1073089 RepID=A0A1L9REW3_ASPWE|nr:uncharacterized protein ASPWEDRAFT_70998 [Aspergillus wentii DTO 134E9]OJJ33466.1 hypothetical protein ASPWEDRAFT_70998 [Aspergillus wentii DTO 134E9]
MSHFVPSSASPGNSFYIDPAVVSSFMSDSSLVISPQGFGNPFPIYSEPASNISNNTPMQTEDMLHQSMSPYLSHHFSPSFAHAFPVLDGSISGYTSFGSGIYDPGAASNSVIDNHPSTPTHAQEDEESRDGSAVDSPIFESGTEQQDGESSPIPMQMGRLYIRKDIQPRRRTDATHKEYPRTTSRVYLHRFWMS